MISDVRDHLNARPFKPFYILTSGGNRYRVATPEHAGFDPKGTRVVIWFDEGGHITLSGLHMVAIETEAAQAA
jgi:hypothetical protein